MTLLEMVGKLALALLAGGLVGLERERQDRQAGLRTHMLVCAGSALFTLVSMEMAPLRSDPTRIAAQIVTGIGFLGAGTIFRAGTSVRGLTTAAGLWAVAGMGMAVASGGNLMGLALIASVIVYGVNRWLRDVENRWLRVNREIVLRLQPGHDSLEEVMHELSGRGVEVHRIMWLPDPESRGEVDVQLRVRMASPEQIQGLPAALVRLAGVQTVELD